MKLLCSILLISYLALIVPSVPPIPGLLALLGAVFLITLKKPSLGLIVISFLVSSYVIVRWKDFDSILLAGFRTEIFTIFISACILRSILFKDDILKFYNDPIFFLFIFWCLLCFSINSNFNIQLFTLAIRENLEAWFLLPFVISIFKRDIRVIKLVACALVFGASFVALINVLNYYNLIIINIPAYVEAKNFTHERNLLGFSVKRMNPFFGIGPSGGGQYYASMFIQAFLLIFILIQEKFSYFRYKLVKFNIIFMSLFASFLLLVYASLLTASVSSFGSIAIVLIILNSQLKLTASPVTLFRKVTIPVLVILFLTIVDLKILLGINVGSSWDYLTDYFIRFGINLIDRSSNLLTGNSLSLRTASTVVGTDSLGVIDVSWFALIEKFGILGFVLGILFTLKYTYLFLSASIAKYYRHIFTLSGVLLVSLLSYSHAPPIITRPFDYLAMISVAGIYSIVRLKSRTNDKFLVSVQGGMKESRLINAEN